MPKSSALPNPIAEPANANRGKQQGESIAVRKSPPVPNLSMLRVSFILNCAVSLSPKKTLCAKSLQ